MNKLCNNQINMSQNDLTINIVHRKSYIQANTNMILSDKLTIVFDVPYLHDYFILATFAKISWHYISMQELLTICKRPQFKNIKP
jgi:hypothetical protein